MIIISRFTESKTKETKEIVDRWMLGLNLVDNFSLLHSELEPQILCVNIAGTATRDNYQQVKNIILAFLSRSEVEVHYFQDDSVEKVLGIMYFYLEIRDIIKEISKFGPRMYYINYLDAISSK